MAVVVHRLQQVMINENPTGDWFVSFVQIAWGNRQKMKALSCCNFLSSQEAVSDFYL
ncbi:hypothetical protein I5P77_00025 [Serratia ureilytica]|uniref:hypothetical protein n=1 Tax=Serratia ureilytica TaxID=300181 RepID=UPI0018D7607D|nr:hypothetical protein [Serratia ureilytica]MBH2651820.1 hypothetical protein [Serratia ureilytica]